MNRSTTSIVLAALSLFLAFAGVTALAQDCRTIAAPPPLVTFGGPSTVPRGDSEVALGAGFGGTEFDCTHKTGSAWFGRFRHGMTDQLDFGADMLVAQHQDEGAATAKIAMRYRIRKRLRLEAGIGGADDSAGKSLNADLGIAIGTMRDRTWNYFTAVRIAGAHGYPGSVCCSGSASGGNVPPTNALLLGSIGASGRISDNAHFVFEAGLGGVRVHFTDRYETGRIFYLAAGVMFDVRKRAQ